MNKVEAFFNLPIDEINSEVIIQGTIYDRSRRYGDVTRGVWKKLYAKGVTVTTISKAYGASFKTVKTVVDPKYKEEYLCRRKASDKKYRDKNELKPVENWAEYRKDLANRKLFPDVAHLRTI